MAAEFIGASMLVTLIKPPARLQGVVTDVKSGCSLTLSNAWSVDANIRLHSDITIEAVNIANLVEIPAPTTLRVPMANISAAPVAPSASLPSGAGPLSDPAIIAVGKPPPSSRAQLDSKETRVPSSQLSQSIPVERQHQSAVVSSTDCMLADATVPQEPVINHASRNASGPVGQTQTRKKSRRPRTNRTGRSTAVQEDATVGGSGYPQALAQGSKGWRQTPILEDTSSFQPFNSLRRGRGRKGTAAHHDNGWASEDVTDVQEMGEFDFEGGLAKFDKDTLFSQLRRDDQIDDAARLVSHNRQQRPKPGTAGGKNLHYSENVLGPPPTGTTGKGEPPNDFWNSEADDGVVNSTERLSGREPGSRQSSRRGESKISTRRRSQSRKADTTLALLPSGRRVETVVSALQMLNLENIAHNELGLTEEIMTENAARGIAEVALIALADPAVRLQSGNGGGGVSRPPPATVAVLAGNNKSGIRAVAAARHLRNKGIDTLVCVVGMERGERELLEGLRQQLRLLRNFGGRVYSKSELFEHVRMLSIPTLTVDTPRGARVPKPPPVTLIIDALLGLATPFDELRTGEQATVYELVEWANRNEAFVLAVDVPTGIDPSTGNVSVVDGNRFYVRPRYVVAMGAPKKGLLESIASSEAAELDAVQDQGNTLDDCVADWKLFIVDIGLGPAVWKKAGARMRHGIDFGISWVLEMKFFTSINMSC